MSKDTVKQEWLLITPGATEFNDHVIRGLCVEIIDTPYKGSQKVLHYLPVDDLPTDPSVSTKTCVVSKTSMLLQHFVT